MPDKDIKPIRYEHYPFFFFNERPFDSSTEWNTDKKPIYTERDGVALYVARILKSTLPRILFSTLRNLPAAQVIEEYQITHLTASRYNISKYILRTKQRDDVSTLNMPVKNRYQYQTLVSIINESMSRRVIYVGVG